MATKKDLIEAQGFSRRRLLSAFTGGAPGGKELDPAKPLRAVTAGIALTAMVILGGVFYGLIRPGLPEGWENNKLVLVSDTGARYLTVDGVLHPVINTASARLLVPAGEFSVISADQETLSDIEIGSTIGIVGAPDDLPPAESLIGDGWTACAVEDGQTTVSISPTPIADSEPGIGTVVSRGDEMFVVADGFRYAVDPAEANAVLRAVGLGSVAPVPVDGRWLNLFQPGNDLGAVHPEGAGDPIAGTSVAVGAVVHADGTPEERRYLVLENGELAPLSPLAYQLYLIGNAGGAEQSVSPAEIADLPTADDPAGGADWPAETLTPIGDGQVPCALLGNTEGTPTTVLGAAPAADAQAGATGQPVAVAVGAGALMRTSDAAPAFLIDESGTAFPVPGGETDLIERLGYSNDDILPLSSGWIDFFPVGPTLTPEAAGSSPVTEAAGSDAGSP